MANAGQPLRKGSRASGSEFDAANVIVEVKFDWADSWGVWDYVYPESAALAVAPEVDRAAFRYDYGEVKREDENTYRDLGPFDLIDKYIRIVAVGAGRTRHQLFVGVVSGDGIDIEGTADAALSGTQQITAYGLGHVLDRTTIRGAHAVEDPVGLIEIGRTPTFNKRDGKGMKNIAGNRSENVESDGVYVFADAEYEWTHKQIIDYLLEYHTPRDSNGDKIIEFKLAGQFDMLDDIISVVSFEGLSLFQALNKLISRRRGMSYKLVTSGSGVVNIYVFSLLGEKQTWGNITFPENPNPHTIRLDDKIDIEKAVRVKDTTTKYEKVHVLGNRIKSCFTLSYADTSLEKGWSNDLETDYKNESSDRERLTRQGLYGRVFRFHRTVNGWDGTAGDGEGGTATKPVSPKCDDDGRLQHSVDANGNRTKDLEAADLWNNRARGFLRRLPLLEIDDTEIGNLGDTDPEFRKTMVFMKNPRENNEFFRVDEPVDEDLRPLSVKISDKELGIIVSGGRVNHYTGLNHFDHTAYTPVSKNPPVLDYEELVATVFMETDERLRVSISTDGYPRAEVPRELVIRVHDAELWYIVPNTVVGVEDGALVRYDPNLPTTITDVYDVTEKYILRDDSERLRQIAQFARAYYSKQRSKVTYEVNFLGYVGFQGNYIRAFRTQTQVEEVRSVCTRVSYDFGEGKFTTKLETEFLELAFSDIIDVPGMSDLDAVGRAHNALVDRVTDAEQHIGGIPDRVPDAHTVLVTDDKHENEGEYNHSSRVVRMSDGKAGDYDDKIWVRHALLAGPQRTSGLRPGDRGYMPRTRLGEYDPTVSTEEESHYRLMERMDELPISDGGYGGVSSATGSAYSYREGGWIIIPGAPDETTYQRDDQTPNAGKIGQRGDVFILDSSNRRAVNDDGDDVCIVAIRHDAIFFMSSTADGAIMFDSTDVSAHVEPAVTYFKGRMYLDSSVANQNTAHAPFESGKWRPVVGMPWPVGSEGELGINPAACSDQALFYLWVGDEANNRLVLSCTPSLSMGPGGATALDTFLTRSAAGIFRVQNTLRTEPGTAAAPAYSFTGRASDGMYSTASGILSWTTAGVQRIALSNSALASVVPFWAPAGSAAVPSYSFGVASNLGFYKSGAAGVALATSGVQRYLYRASGFRGPSGTGVIPAWSFLTDTNTGINNATADTLNLITGGAIRVVINTAKADFNTPIRIKEIAAAVADTAGYGQLWVKNTTPCELWFTDDAGTDTQIV